MLFKAIHSGKRCLLAAGAIVAMWSCNSVLAQTGVSIGPSPNGTVTLRASGTIQCITDQTLCSKNLAKGTSVELTATPDTGFKFTQWVASRGVCARDVNPCTFTINNNMESVRAIFDVDATATPPTTGNTFQLILKSNGSGKVTSAPAGIDCASGSTNKCSASFSKGTKVTLRATPDAKHSFTNWTGACSGESTNTCTVTMDAEKKVEARFVPTPTSSTLFELTVDRSGGNGTVTSEPAGIDCGTQCSALFGEGTKVTLTATPDPKYAFYGWTGACSNVALPTCSVTMDEKKKVEAKFTLITQYPLKVHTQGNGNGTVISAPSGIFCGADCEFAFPVDDPVTLKAQAQPGSVFRGWTGACSGNQDTCVVTMDKAQDVTATFNSISKGDTFNLTVHKDGEGSVSSSPAGILCGTSCSIDFTFATDKAKTITLKAFPSKGHRLLGWYKSDARKATACNAGSRPNDCIVDLTQASTDVFAVFVQDTCAARSFSPEENLIMDGYIAYYGRMPMAFELRYWLTELAEKGGDIWSQGFAMAGGEYRRLFGNKDDDELVDKLYKQIYGRFAEPGGLNYYTKELKEKRKTLSTIALEILAGARNDDLMVLENRRRVARYFAFITESRGSSLIHKDTEQRTLMSTVTDNFDSVNAACKKLNDSLL